MGAVIDFQNQFVKRDTGKRINQYDINKGNQNRDDEMDNNKILELYIAKVDKDQSELKQDIRESENRIFQKVSDSEERMNKRLDKIEDLIKDQNTKFDKMDDKIVEVSQSVKNGLEDYRKFLWGITISILLAIATMIITMVVTIITT